MENETKDPSRARAAEERLAKLIKQEPAVRKVVRKSASLAELMTEGDREDDLRVLREAKKASTRVYDIEKRKFIEFPDHKTRLAAATLSRAYDEGTPIQRQIVVSRHFESAADIISRVKESPELLNAVLGLQAQGVQVEADGEIIKIETDVQRSE